MEFQIHEKFLVYLEPIQQTARKDRKHIQSYLQVIQKSLKTSVRYCAAS